MHNTQVEVEGVVYNCNHNGDYSGDIWVDVPIARIPMMKGWFQKPHLTWQLL